MNKNWNIQFVVVVHSVMSNSLWPHGLEHTMPPCPSPSPEICLSSCPLHWWCHPAISSSVTPSPPAFNLSQHQGLFQWVGSLHQVAKVMKLQLQLQSFQWIVRVDFLSDWLVGSPCCPRDSQESSPVPQYEGISSSALSLFYCPALTTICDHWEDHTLDYTDLFGQTNASAFQHCLGCHHFPAMKQLSFVFMAAIAIYSDFRAQEKEISHYFHLSPLYLPWSNGRKYPNKTDTLIK